MKIYVAIDCHERTKHIELDSHFVGDEAIGGNVILRHVGMTSQLAGIFTKPLGRDGFTLYRRFLITSNDPTGP